MTGCSSVQTPEAIAANPVRTSPPRSAKRRGVVTETKVAIRGLACSRLRSFMRPSLRFNETASRGNLSDARLLSMDACFAIGHRMFVANSHVRNCERRDQVFVGCVESSRRTGPAVVVRLEDSTHPTELDDTLQLASLQQGDGPVLKQGAGVPISKLAEEPCGRWKPVGWPILKLEHPTPIHSNSVIANEFHPTVRVRPLGHQAVE